MSAHGPYLTREQAIADMHNPAGFADNTWRYHQLKRALDPIDLGDTRSLDRAILAQVAGSDPETVQVVIGWIERTRAAAEDELRVEIGKLEKQITSLETEVRRAGPVNVDLDAVLARIEGGTR